MKLLRQYRQHVRWVIYGLLLVGLAWLLFGTQPTAVPLATLRFDDNEGLGAPYLDLRISDANVQVDREGNSYVITRRVAKEVEGQLQMLVLAPDGKVTAIRPLRRHDGRPLTADYIGGGVFVVNPQGTRWWLLRHASEDWSQRRKNVVLLSVHDTDGRALQEWKMPITELFAELSWFYTAGDNRVAIAWGDSNVKMFILGQREPRQLNLDCQDAVMPNGAAWRCEMDPWDATASATAQFTIIYTPPGGRPQAWPSFQGIGAMQPSVIIPSTAGLVVRAGSPRNIPGIYRISQDGRYTCLYSYADMADIPQESGREEEEFSFSYPIYANRHGDHWRTSTSKGKIPHPDSYRRCTVWKFTKLPRWQIWLRAQHEKNTLR